MFRTTSKIILIKKIIKFVFTGFSIFFIALLFFMNHQQKKDKMYIDFPKILVVTKRIS